MKRVDTPRGPIFAWVPTGASRRAVVVYVHGYGNTAASAVGEHQLEAQFQRAGKRVPFLVPEAPSSSAQAVNFPDLGELLAAVGLGGAQVVGVAHSGGYRTILTWLKNPALRHLILLDAVYAGAPQLEAWAAQPGHTLDIVGQDTATASRALATATRSPYTAAASHMGIVTEGTLIPRLIARAPLPGGGAGLAVGILVAVGWGLWRLLR